VEIMMKPIHWQKEMGRITLLPERGRILQVTVGGQAAFWNNPQWTGDWNVGGDRLWVAPEVDWFWNSAKRPDVQQYQIPATVDPGRWQVENLEPSSCRWRQRSRVECRHRKSAVDIELTRCISLVADADVPYFTQWMAYRTDNELRVLSGTKGQRIGLWSLLQIPAGGQLIFPCRSKPAFRLYFGSIPPALWSRTAEQVTCRITGDHQYKIGFAPDVIRGRMIYARPVKGGQLVTYREFHPQPWRDYADRPLSALQTQGDAVQVYNDSGKYGGFGEMEYHSPALTVGRGNDYLQDASYTVVGFVPTRNWQKWVRHWVR